MFAQGKSNPNLHCKHIRPFPVFKHQVWRIICVIAILPIVFLISPRNLVRYWKLERKDGHETKEILRRMYINAHILRKKMDWLHFGFATTAIGREKVAKAIQTKMAVSLRGYDINEYPVKYAKCYQMLWKHVDQVHSISNYLLQKAYELGLSPDKPSCIIFPAISLPPIHKSDFSLHDPIRILTVGRLTSIKGLSYCIESIAKLKEGGIHAQYTIVGDGIEYEKLVRQTEALGIKEDVIFAGILSHSEILMLMRDCDIYVQPSINEGFCNAVLEAQAVGSLCIASDVGALPENIVNGETGWLVQSMDANALANSILNTVRLSPIDKRKVSNNARTRVAKSFTIDTHLKSWNQFYQT